MMDLIQPIPFHNLQGSLNIWETITSSILKQVRLRVLSNRSITTLIGTGLFDFGFKDGIGKEGQLQHPIGLFVDGTGIYIADTYNSAIRHYDLETRELSTIAGSEAHLNEPNDIVKIEKKLYITDTNHHLIRMIDLETKRVSTLPLAIPPEMASLCTGGDLCRRS